MEEFLDSDDEQIRMRAAMHLLKTVPLTHKNQKYPPRTSLFPCNRAFSLCDQRNE